MLTPAAERLRSDPFIHEVRQRPRVWVFGSEAGLEAVASGVTWAGVM